MFIIPTWLLKEKSMMVPPDNIKTVEILSEVDVETIRKILSLEKKFNDFIFEPSTWFDGFIVELLRWFDNKINEISDNDNEFDQWKTYYVQIVKILYHFVVYEGLYDYDDLVKLVFKYLFYSSCEIYLNPYENDYNFISPEKLMYVYYNIIGRISDLHHHPGIDWKPRLDDSLFIGKWDTEERWNKLDNVVIKISANENKSAFLYEVTIFDRYRYGIFEEDNFCNDSDSDSDS